MDRRQLLFGMTGLAVGTSTLKDLLTAQSMDVAKQTLVTGNSQIGDREQAGLRGPVRTVSEGSRRTEYDPAGRLISSRWSPNPDSESIETRTYDGSGRLLTDTIRNADGSLIEKVYFYDDKGRLLRIVEGSGDRTFFQYDQEGRKIKIRDVADKSDDQEAERAVGIDVMFADVEEDSEFGLDGARNASRIKTIYDELDQPTETQAFDADGHLLSRIVRAYDAKRRITNVRVIIDDPTSLFPAQAKARWSRNPMYRQMK